MEVGEGINLEEEEGGEGEREGSTVGTDLTAPTWKNQGAAAVLVWTWH